MYVYAEAETIEENKSKEYSVRTQVLGRVDHLNDEVSFSTLGLIDTLLQTESEAIFSNLVGKRKKQREREKERERKKDGERKTHRQRKIDR